LASWAWLGFIGGSQFRKICVLSLATLVISVFWTCWCVDRRKEDFAQNLVSNLRMQDPSRNCRCERLQEAGRVRPLITSESEGRLSIFSKSGLGQVIQNIVTSVVKLPRPIRRVCYVQVCAFMGWCVFDSLVHHACPC
jgi:solute carrier family 45 protein 1/2/4